MKVKGRKMARNSDQKIVVKKVKKSSKLKSKIVIKRSPRVQDKIRENSGKVKNKDILQQVKNSCKVKKSCKVRKSGKIKIYENSVTIKFKTGDKSGHATIKIQDKVKISFI